MNFNWPNLKDFKFLIFDFDGVFTDNKVYLNLEGEENVCCDRRDGLAINMLKKYLNKIDHNLDVFILSTEKNSVVKARAEKMQIKCYHGVGNKAKFLSKYFKENNLDVNNAYHDSIYIGNDLNDLQVMERVGFSVAPNDAHPIIKQCSSSVLPLDGGHGFVRMIIENFLNINFMQKGEISELVFNS